MNTKVSTSRLLRLANFLDGVPRERFDYKTFVGDDWQGKQNLSCGTTACALGWAATMPFFRKLGLRLEYANRYGASVVVKNRPFNGSSLESAEFVFGITREQARYLFIPDEIVSFTDVVSPSVYASAKEVARHIRRFVKKYLN